MSRTYKTKNGTELPILSLRGKDYLEVKYRLVWFREDHPDWGIETEFVAITDNSATARATVKDASGRAVATSHKFENAQGFPDFLEKAETGAIGRALALVGYGTQFCADELDEADRIVDAPVDKPKAKLQSIPKATSARSEHQGSPKAQLCELCSTQLQATKKGDALYCPNFKDRTQGEHSYVSLKTGSNG